jgi:hypothetical protein
MSKKNKNRRFIEQKKSTGDTTRKNFVTKDGKSPVPPEPVGDRVRMLISPIVLPPMVNAACPSLMEPFGIEFMITHGTASLPDQSDKSEFRALHIAADHAGCGWWRFHEIEDVVNYSKKGYILNTGLRLPREYLLSVKFDAIRLQRQVGPGRAEYWKNIKEMFRETNTNTRMIFEVDDVICKDKLPEFNEAKDSFNDDKVQESLHQMLDICDEMFVVSPYMRQVYRKYHQSCDISVIPNFASRAWFDGYYDLEKRMKDFDKHKYRPRILLPGGATHVNQYDRNIYSESDYTRVVDAIISARHDFEFVIMGVQPNVFRSFIENGEMTYIRWAPQYLYPQVLNNLGVQCVIAPLADNEFNRSKSSIKWQESCYMGFGFAGQRLEPYTEARHLFDAGPELIDLLKSITKDEQTFEEEVKYNRSQAEKYWIDDKIDDIITLYKTPYADPARKEIKWFVDLNPAQFGVQKK